MIAPTRARALLATSALLAPTVARADEPAVQLDGDGPSSLLGRVRVELEALGHRVLSARDAHASAAAQVALHVEADQLIADVAVLGRAPVRVVVSASEQDADALFALRVAEAVRAGLLSVPRPPPPPPPGPPPLPPPAPLPQTLAARPWGVGVGVRALFSPGGVGPMVLPYVCARWASDGYAEVVVAAPSLGGAAEGPSTLSVVHVSAGAGVSLSVARRLRVELGARAEYLSLAWGYDDTATVVRDGTFALSGVGALSWRAHDRIAVRLGAFGGAAFSLVTLGIGARMVAEWGRALGGAELGAEFLF